MSKPTCTAGPGTPGIPFPSRGISAENEPAPKVPTRKPSGPEGQESRPKNGDIPRPSRETTGTALLKRVDPARRAAVEERAAQIPPKYLRGYLRAAAGSASPRAAVKSFCLECLGWISADVTDCTAPACPLYQYRPFQGNRK